MDMGPPHDFYEIYNVRQSNAGVFVERVTVSPPGLSCITPAKVEYSSGTISGSIKTLLADRNPCDISEKEIHKELNRKNCKHCRPVFSGSDVAMRLNCSTRERVIDISVLDRDMFDTAANTPDATMWSMQVFTKLDSVLAPGPWEQPMFALSISTPSSGPDPEPQMVQQVSTGALDSYFKSDKPLSEYYLQSKIPINQPTVTISNRPKDTPITAPLPKYPHIAHLARYAGDVSLAFDIDALGKPTNIVTSSEPKASILATSATQAVKAWQFSPTAVGHNESVTLSYKLNCNPNDQ